MLGSVSGCSPPTKEPEPGSDRPGGAGREVGVPPGGRGGRWAGRAAAPGVLGRGGGWRLVARFRQPAGAAAAAAARGSMRETLGKSRRLFIPDSHRAFGPFPRRFTGLAPSVQRSPPNFFSRTLLGSEPLSALGDIRIPPRDPRRCPVPQPPLRQEGWSRPLRCPARARGMGLPGIAEGRAWR